MTRRRRPLIALVAAFAIAVAVSDGLLVSIGHAQQDDTQAANYGIYNGQVAATADREQVGSTTNPGFTAGLVNNFYPFARVNVAVAGTSAAASPADTGPFAQAVFAGQNVNQPQYVFAQNPGNPNPAPYSAGPATASASAGPASAKAAGTYGAVGNSTGTAPSTTPPDGSDGGSASDTSYFDSSLGFVTIGDSRVHHASYGAGVLSIDNVHVAVQVSTTGSTFSKTIAITVGGAAVTVPASAPLGQSVTIPVTIDQNGITATQPLVPGTPLQAATDMANAALAAAGLSVHTVAPQVTQDGADLHVDAVGVVINQQNIGGVGGVPNQFVIHTLGEVVLDNEAVPGGSQTDLSNSLGSSGDTSAPSQTTTSTSTVIGGTSDLGSTAPSSANPVAIKPPQPNTRPVDTVITQPQPRWLLLAYLAWQALMFALVGALYLHRVSTRRLA